MTAAAKKEYWVEIRENGQTACWEFFGDDRQDAEAFKADPDMIEKWGGYNMILRPVNEGEYPLGFDPDKF